MLAVVLACRNIAKGNELKAELEANCASRGLPRPNLEVRVLDLSSLRWVGGWRLGSYLFQTGLGLCKEMWGQA
jgi:hypothetical protein